MPLNTIKYTPVTDSLNTNTDHTEDRNWKESKKKKQSVTAQYKSMPIDRSELTPASTIIN